MPFCEKEPKDVEKYLLKKGDVVISRAGSVGYSYLINETQLAVFASYLIRFKPNINEKYFKYFLESPFYWTSISEQKLGIAIPNVNATKIKQISIPIPPYNEQVRIVVKIEELFKRLNQGTKNLQDTQMKLEHYRQSSFNILIEQNRNYPIKEVGQLVTVSKERFNPLESEPEPYIGLADIERDTGKIINVGLSDETRSLKSTFHSGDVLYGRLRPYLNKVTVPDFNGVCSTDILVFNTMDCVDPYYLQYVLMSNSFVSYATRNMSGVHHPRVKYDVISTYEISLPPIEIQKQIRIKYEEMLSRIHYLESNINSTIKKCDLCAQSVLKRAFSGGLVPQDPSDEPASVLLETITAEKAKIKPTRGRGRKK